MPTINPADTELLRTLRDGGDLPVHALFAELAELYHKRNPKARNKDLAALLGCPPQHVSQYKTGSDPRRKPTWAHLLLLCSLTGRKLEITPAGARVVVHRKRRKASA